MSNLEIDVLDDSGDIRLSIRGNYSQSDFDLFNTFWRSISKHGDAKTGLIVEASIFVSNFEWCRNVWQGVNRSLSITTGARAFLSFKKNLRDDFNMLLSTGPSRAEGIHVVEPVARPLAVHQKSNVLDLLGMRNGANFSVPGAGKTATTLSVWATLRNEGVIERLFVVCPKSAFESWRLEAEIFDVSPSQFQAFEGRPLGSNVLIAVCNYEQLQNDANLETISIWLKSAKTQVVLDESHRVKAGPDSVRWRACHSLVKDAVRVDLLSGTPMPQALSDVRNQFRLSWQGLSPNDLNDAVILRMRR